MSDRAALVAAVAAHPDDDLPRLVFADWLDEHGEPERAEFVRLCVAHSRESAAFPPAPAPTRRRRIHDLFAAHHGDWLRPVYDALARPLPTFTATQDRWSVQPLGGVTVSHSDDRAMASVVLRGGLVSKIVLCPTQLPENASLAAAMTAEPIAELHLALPGIPPAAWRLIDGPHLARVRSLTPQFTNTRSDGVEEVAELLCDPARFPGVREMTVLPELWQGTQPPTAVLFDTLRGSHLRRQLTRLSLYDLPGVARLLARSDHGFDALRELTVSARGQPGGADALFAGGVSHWFRERLSRLAIDAPRTRGLDWLTTGTAWDRLEGLSLSGGGVGDAGAAALADADALPALRELRLHRAGVTPLGADALAASPLVGRLQALFVDGSPLGDAGAVRLAAALDRGLTYLALRSPQPALSPSVVQGLTARYGPRIAFD